MVRIRDSTDKIANKLCESEHICCSYPIYKEHYYEMAQETEDHHEGIPDVPG
jgi:hypothetical protein